MTAIFSLQFILNCFCDAWLLTGGRPSLERPLTNALSNCYPIYFRSHNITFQRLLTIVHIARAATEAIAGFENSWYTTIRPLKHEAWAILAVNHIKKRGWHSLGS